MEKEKESFSTDFHKTVKIQHRERGRVNLLTTRPPKQHSFTFIQERCRKSQEHKVGDRKRVLLLH